MTAERQAGTTGYPRTAGEGLRGSVHARCQLVGWLRPLREEISASVTEPLAAESWSHKAREALPAGRAGAVLAKPPQCPGSVHSSACKGREMFLFSLFLT